MQCREYMYCPFGFLSQREDSYSHADWRNIEENTKLCRGQQSADPEADAIPNETGQEGRFSSLDQYMVERKPGEEASVTSLSSVPVLTAIPEVHTSAWNVSHPIYYLTPSHGQLRYCHQPDNETHLVVTRCTTLSFSSHKHKLNVICGPVLD